MSTGAPTARQRRLGWGVAATLAIVIIGALVWLSLPSLQSGGETGFRSGWRILRPPHDVNALTTYDGLVLAGGRDGVVAFDPDSVAAIELPPNLPEMSYVKALLVESNGRLWIGHRGGLTNYDGMAWETLAADPAAAPGPIATLIETRDGRLLAGGEAGLAEVTENGFDPIALPAPFGQESISALFEDAQHRLWIGLSSPTRGGLLVRDGMDWQVLGSENGLVHTTINAIEADSAGHILVASGYSGRGGACRLENDADLNSWKCLTAADGLASDMVRLVHEDTQGRIWYGSEFKGLAVARDGWYDIVVPADGLAGTELKAFLEDPSGALWLGCDKGLTHITAQAAKDME